MTDGDWTGKKCPSCLGYGLKTCADGEERRCDACGGTGDEWLSWKERAEKAEAELARLRQTLSECFAASEVADDAVDKDTYEQKRHDDFDTPDDGEMFVQAGTLRKVNRVFVLLDKINKALTSTVPTGKSTR